MLNFNFKNISRHRMAISLATVFALLTRFEASYAMDDAMNVLESKRFSAVRFNCDQLVECMTKELQNNYYPRLASEVKRLWETAIKTSEQSNIPYKKAFFEELNRNLNSFLAHEGKRAFNFLEDKFSELDSSQTIVQKPEPDIIKKVTYPNVTWDEIKRDLFTNGTLTIMGADGSKWRFLNSPQFVEAVLRDKETNPSMTRQGDIELITNDPKFYGILHSSYHIGDYLATYKAEGLEQLLYLTCKPEK